MWGAQEQQTVLSPGEGQIDYMANCFGTVMGQGRFWTTELICYFAAVWMTKCTGIGIRRFLVSILALELVA